MECPNLLASVLIPLPATGDLASTPPPLPMLGSTVLALVPAPAPSPIPSAGIDSDPSLSSSLQSPGTGP